METEKQKYDIDNTFRYIYDAFRFKEGLTVAIEFKHNGRIWRADTADEAIALRQKLIEQDDQALAQGINPSVVEDAVWTPDVIMDLIKNAGTMQIKFLRMLAEKSTFTSDEAIEKLKLKSEVSFAGVLSGLSKQLKKLGRQPWELYTSDVAWLGKGEKRRTFRVSSSFHYAVEELGGFESLIQ